MQKAVLYSAGSSPGPFKTVFRRQRKNLDNTHAALLSRFLELWCFEECLGEWQIEETTTDILVHLSDPIDIIKFRFSEDSSKFETV